MDKVMSLVFWCHALCLSLPLHDCVHSKRGDLQNALSETKDEISVPYKNLLYSKSPWMSTRQPEIVLVVLNVIIMTNSWHVSVPERHSIIVRDRKYKHLS
jgi:hypothetical protein